MAQDGIYIAVRSQVLSQGGEARYVIINRETREVMDNNQGRGYKTPQAAHSSFAVKRKWRRR